MNTAEVFSLFKQYADEPDATWLTDADIQIYLDRGYEEFRRIVIQQDPYIYYETVTLDFTSDEYDLADPASAVRILGSSIPVGTKRLEYLTGVHAANSSNKIIWTYQIVPNYRALHSVAQSAMLIGSKLKLSGNRTGKVLVEYVPEVDIDWTLATGFIDDLTMFHDVIALLAYKQYAIRDGAVNQPLMMQLATRINNLMEYIVERNNNASHYVSRVMNTYTTM